MAINRIDIAAHLERNVRVGFLRGYQEYTPLRSAFAREVPSDGAYELYADMGTPPWPQLNSGKQGAGGTDSRTGAPAVNRLNSGANIVSLDGEERSLFVRNLDWEVTIPITHNAIDDDKAGDLETWARQTAINFQKHMDYLCFNALESGTATTTYGPGYDNQAFFSSSHADPGAEYVTAQQNTWTLSLSLTNFETVKVAASKFKDSRGQPVGLNHNLLIVPSDLERIAANITDNAEDYTTTDRKANPYSGKVKRLVAPGGWLTSTTWVIIDPTQVVKPINIQVRKAPTLTVWDNEYTGDGGTRYFKWHSRYAVFYGDWRLAARGY